MTNDHHEETEQEFKERMKRIATEIKADMKAGRYRHGQLHPDVSAQSSIVDKGGRGSSKLTTFEDLYKYYLSMEMMDFATLEKIMPKYGAIMSGRYSTERPPFYELYGGRPDHLVLDSIPYTVRKITPDKQGQEKDGPKKAYWHQPIPDPNETKPVSSPSQAKRAKLRAKRNKHK